MNAQATRAFTDRMPSKIDRDTADSLRKIVAACQSEDGSSSLLISSNRSEKAEITLSPSMSEALLDLLRVISAGHGCRIIPVDSKLTTQQSADILNVSRPYLIKILEEGKIPFEKVGRHRRIRAEDLFAYKSERDADREDALASLASYDAEKGYL